jgi:hypothetical protein
MADPLISIIVPAFNVSAYLRRCVDSLLRQTHRNLQIVIVNDHSTDDTGEQLDRFAALDPRVEPLHLSTNVGMHAARAAGLRLARGEFVGYIDADDWIAPGMYADLLAHSLEADADIAICGATVAYDETRLGDPKVRFRRRRVFQDDLLGRFCRLEFGSGVLWNKLYRAAIIRPNATMLLGRHLGEDYIINVGCFAAASRVVTLPTSHYRYFRRADSASEHRSCAARFVELIQGYVACLETYADSPPEQLQHIDGLFARQLSLGYATCSVTELHAVDGLLREYIHRLADVHPAGIYTLVHAFDPRFTARQPGFAASARAFLEHGRSLVQALPLGRLRQSLNLRSMPSKP